MGPPDGVLTALTHQQWDQQFDRAPIVTRSDGGGVQDGLDHLRLTTDGMTAAGWDNVNSVYRACIPYAGFCRVQYWDEDNGGVSVVRFAVMRHPPRRGGPFGPNVTDVEVAFYCLGIPWP